MTLGRRAWVEDLAVDPEARSTGIGSMLLAAARAWAAERGDDQVGLESGLGRTRAHAFYEREGSPRFSYAFRWAT